MRILPMGEPMALSLKPCLSRRVLNSWICKSDSASTLAPRIERNSMWRMPQDFRTSSCVCGSGEISSAKALRVNMREFLIYRGALAPCERETMNQIVSPVLHNRQLRLLGDEGALAALGEADLHFAHDAVAADGGDTADAVDMVLYEHSL